MTHKKTVDYFTNKYYEIARKYRIYTKCRDNTSLMEMCVNTAIGCGMQSLEYETVDEISEEDWHYFLLIGEHIMEAMIIVAKRNYAFYGGAYDSKK